MLLMEEILHHHNGIKLPTSSGCPPQPSNRMSCLPTNHLKNLVDFGPFTRRESSVSQMAALGTKSTNNSEDELTCSIVISEGACPDLGGDLTGTVLNFFSGISHGIFFFGGRFGFFFLLGVIFHGKVRLCFLRNIRGKDHGFFVGTPNNHLVPFWCCLQDGEDRDSSDAFGAETRLLDQAPGMAAASGFFFGQMLE